MVATKGLAQVSAGIIASGVLTMGTSLLWLLLLIVMYALECLVAFIQAFVFSILTASYVGGAVHPH